MEPLSDLVRLACVCVRSQRRLSQAIVPGDSEKPQICQESQRVRDRHSKEWRQEDRSTVMNLGRSQVKSSQVQYSLTLLHKLSEMCHQ